MSVALVGGKRLNKYLLKLLKKDNDIRKVYVCCMEYVEVGKELGEKTVVVDEKTVYDVRADVVVEDVGAEKAKDVIRSALKKSSHVVVVSASVFSDKLFLKEVEELTKEVGKYVVVPFGALPAMDALEALSLDTLEAVDIWIRRSPRQLLTILKEAGLEPEAVEVPVVVYEGSALEEIVRVKEDINTLMAAVLASRKDPNIKIVADKDVKGSEYRIKIKSEIAQIEISAKYKTIEETRLSEIMVYSVYRAIKRLLTTSGVVVF